MIDELDREVILEELLTEFKLPDELDCEFITEELDLEELDLEELETVPTIDELIMFITTELETEFMLDIPTLEDVLLTGVFDIGSVALDTCVTLADDLSSSPPEAPQAINVMSNKMVVRIFKDRTT